MQIFWYDLFICFPALDVGSFMSHGNWNGNLVDGEIEWNWNWNQYPTHSEVIPCLKCNVCSTEY